MIYAMAGAMLLYKGLEVGSWWWFTKIRRVPWAHFRFDLWFALLNVLFIILMLAVALPYRPKSELFRWSSPIAVGALRSAAWGLAGGVVAFAAASPIFWYGDRQLYFVRLLIANALSPLGAAGVVLFVVALGLSSELAYRGVVFRTLVETASVPAAVVGSCLLFAWVYPALSFPVATILGVVSALLYYRTRNLIAPIIANIVVTLGGGALTLYRGLMRG
ncbi:MAG TPA: CPBP family intramembrane glutamic endopeptidase [Terriglobales bacterium]|nr:CPBP family intramembrane glutamic endopeptidase [Terriglobales bacterium]